MIFLTPAADGRTEVVPELSGGMGRGPTAPPGSVPEVGERLCYTPLSDVFLPAGAFPTPEDSRGRTAARRRPAAASDGDRAEEWP